MLMEGEGVPAPSPPSRKRYINLSIRGGLNSATVSIPGPVSPSMLGGSPYVPGAAGRQIRAFDTGIM
jgi:hypothetical protein